MTRSIDESYEEIQANVLTSFGTLAAGYFFLAIDDAGAFRTALRDVLLARVTSEGAVQKSDDLPHAVQVGFTYAGLQRLNVDDGALAQLPDAFSQGMAQRAELLGDRGASSPVNWEGAFGRGTIHLVVCVLSKSNDPGVVEAAWRQLCADGGLGGTVLLHTCRGQSQLRTDGSVTYRVEPFGFRDGISQPDVDLPHTTPAGGALGRIAPGEFILGYDDETDRTLGRPHPVTPPLLENGTYMVFRKIQQLQSELEKFVTAQAPVGDDRARLTAELFGRWPNGAVLTAAPQPPAQTDAVANDFLFKGPDDRCPVWSHIRRANPRNGVDPRIVRRHRIIRRGIRYQSNGNGEGVLFICFNARIDDQFEFIQGTWLNNGNFADLLSNSVDPIANTDAVANTDADHSASYDRPGGAGTIKNLPQLTQVRGGEYFLLPSRAALAQLAALVPRLPGTPGAPEPESPGDDLFDFEAVGPLALTEDAPSKPVPRQTGLERLYYVGQHALVTQTLQNDTDFEVTPYDERIQSLTSGQRLLIGMSPVRDAAARAAREKLLAASMSPADSAQVADIVRGVLNGVVANSGPVNLVDAVGRAVPLAVVVQYLGVRLPGPPVSETAIGAALGRLPGDVPPEWKASFVQGLAGREGMYNLAFWSRMLFVETFLNIEEAPEVKIMARLAIDELFTHLDTVLDKPTPGTVLERAVAQSRADARLLLLELMVGGTDTTAAGITNVVDLLLNRDDAMQQARAAASGGSDADLDAIVQECLRLAPVAGMLLRRSTGQPASVGRTPIDPNSRVCILTAAAANDLRVCPNAKAFDPKRPAEQYLNFGAGAHACAGQWLALVQIRTVLRWLLGADPATGKPRFPRLRRAAGPQGQKIEDFYLPASLYVWLE
jgi:Dyp-type peroxidase family